MPGFVDLHCHFVPGVDDGVRTDEESRLLLRGLKRLGFEHVAATPHMRPGMFETSRHSLETAYGGWLETHGEDRTLPNVSLASEHYFCEEVVERILRGEGLPYTPERAAPKERSRGSILVEFHDLAPPQVIETQLFRLQTRGLVVVIAHPERYRALWSSDEKLERLVELGSYALLDLGALVGKYGREAERTARRLLDAGLYHAACSDAHRESDLRAVEEGMAVIERTYGRGELDYLLETAPFSLLSGERPPDAPS